MGGKATYEFTVQITRMQWAVKQFLGTLSAKRNWFGAVAMIMALSAFTIWVESDAEEPETSPMVILAIFAASVAVFWILAAALAAAKMFVYDKKAFEPTRYSIREEGFTIEAEHVKADLAWPYLHDVRTNKRYCMLYVDKKDAYTIPRSSFPPELDWERFCADCSGWFQLAKAHAEQ